MDDPSRVPIRSIVGYFRVLETLDQLHKGRRKILAGGRPTEIDSVNGGLDADTTAKDNQFDVLIWKIE